MRKLLASIVPFIFLGFALVTFLFGLVLFAYLLLFGALVGIVLFVITWIRERFFVTKSKHTTEAKSGRIIEHKHEE